LSSPKNMGSLGRGFEAKLLCPLEESSILQSVGDTAVLKTLYEPFRVGLANW
jgi:hypothetical protein